MIAPWTAGVLMALGLAAASPRAHAGQPDLERYLSFATVTSAGNAPLTYFSPGTGSNVTHGGVNYDYRISKFEMTNDAWFEFVTAYGPFVDPRRAYDSSFRGEWIDSNPGPNGTVIYEKVPGYDRYPVSVTWEFAARYCNWLENGKALTKAAFENGVYDTSTFTRNPNNTINYQMRHNPGARYWISTANEWFKAAYFDPHRYGPDQPGYWMYPNRSDQPLISGLPGVGQTNAGINGLGSPMQVGSYTDTYSPWGLFDLSGNAPEYLDDPWITEDGDYFGKQFIPSRAGGPTNEYDVFNRAIGVSSLGRFGSFRVASVIPSPATTLLVGAMGVLMVGSRSRSSRPRGVEVSAGWVVTRC
ncbi:MAG: SUMF1/EgtB/PvdO family nonheme iron enzyme [Phycisphaerales bacterium]|nr:SUMF1/EgtB/PvdO family nonheme iron enzyme [Phycisphaerales bacterium]